jgi:hypothetical protein
MEDATATGRDDGRATGVGVVAIATVVGQLTTGKLTVSAAAVGAGDVGSVPGVEGVAVPPPWPVEDETAGREEPGAADPPLPCAWPPQPAAAISSVPASKAVIAIRRRRMRRQSQHLNASASNEEGLRVPNLVRPSFMMTSQC